MRSRWRARIVMGLAATALLSAPVTAQVGGRRGGGQDRAQLEERVRAQMGRLMRERLGLDQDQEARLSAVMQDFDGRRRELAGQEQAARRRVQAVLLEGGTDNDEARALITRMWELRAQEAQLFRSEQEALLDVLSPVQVLRLQELRQELGQRIRALGGGRGDVPPGAGRGRGLRGGGRIGL